MWSTEAEPGLNADVPLSTRLADALEGADELLAAVAYVKRSGSEILAAAGLPSTTRFVVGIGFGLTDPEAVEDLAELGADVRVVVGAEGLRASAFHPKLYIVRREGHLTVFSGSANLTSGGLESNVEQYERLRMSVASPQAEAHTRRFDTLWRMGVDLAELCDIGAWADYVELARRRRERERRDAAEEASVDARMRARLRERHGESLGGRRGDAGAVADRLHALLEEATGIAPEARRRAYVRMDNAIGVRSFQRVGLELWGADLVLAVWPGELQGQARQLYESERAAALVELIETNVRWQAVPSPHLAFPNSPPERRLYLNPTVAIAQYVRQWSEGDMEHVHNYSADQLHDELWPWLLQRGYASPRDADELPRFERSLGEWPIHLRPGIRAWRRWSLDTAEELDARHVLAPEIRATVVECLAVLREPPLPS